MRRSLLFILVVGCVGALQMLDADQSLAKDYWCCCPINSPNGSCQCATGGPSYFYEDSKCTQQMTDDSDNVPFLETSHLYLHCIGVNANRPPNTNYKIDVSGGAPIQITVGENVDASSGQDAFTRVDCSNNIEASGVTVHVEWFDCFNTTVSPPTQ
jgi:hypothetical protein